MFSCLFYVLPLPFFFSFLFLTGSIPDSIGTMVNLFSIMLAHNQLSGNHTLDFFLNHVFLRLFLFYWLIACLLLCQMLYQTLFFAQPSGTLYSMRSSSFFQITYSIVYFIQFPCKYNITIYLSGSIPGSIVNLKALTELDLSNNRLSGELV